MDRGHGVRQLIYRDISQYRHEEACAILAHLNRIERKTFPASEALPFAPDPLKKANTSISFLITSALPESAIVAYAVVVRTGSTARLHKVCVVESWRAQGVGKMLMSNIIGKLAKGGCLCIVLWVDEGREIARRLYIGNDFKELDIVQDYYGPGRTGIKMVLDLEKQNDWNSRDIS